MVSMLDYGIADGMGLVNDQILYKDISMFMEHETNMFKSWEQNQDNTSGTNGGTQLVNTLKVQMNDIKRELTGKNSVLLLNKE